MNDIILFPTSKTTTTLNNNNNYPIIVTKFETNLYQNVDNIDKNTASKNNIQRSSMTSMTSMEQISIDINRNRTDKVINDDNVICANINTGIKKNDDNGPITYANIDMKKYDNDNDKDKDKGPITYANVGVNKVIRNPKDDILVQPRPIRRIFEPIPIKRKNGPLIIHGKRWYFRLVCGKNGEQRRARALMDDYNLNEISHHMVVCFTPDTIPGSTRPFRNPDGDPIRIYGFFDSYLEFYEYMQNFEPSERAFYEIIFGELPQKPHFDMDISMDDLNKLYPGEDMNDVSEILRQAVIMGCIEVLAENMVMIDMTRDILLYSSHGENKRSYHLVLNNKCHDGNKEAKAFYDAVMNKVRIYTNGKYLEFVDKSVYSPRQQFRMVGCQKQGSNRPKVFYEQFWYQGEQYTHNYNEDVTDITMKKLTIIYESMVSFTSGCTFLPSLIPPKLINHNNLGEMPDLDQNIVEHCMIMLREKMDFCPFSVKEVRGHLIALKRHAPSYCPICNLPKPHEKENPFLFILGGKVYWDCRRSENYVENPKKFFVGYLAMTIDELQNGNTIPGIINGDGAELDEDQGGEFMFGDYNIGTPTLQPLQPLKKLSETPTNDQHISHENSPLIPSNTIPPEQRMQNVHANISKIAKDWAMKKYIRQEPEDITGIRTLTSINNHITWTPGLK
jgi:hypothetical protein